MNLLRRFIAWLASSDDPEARGSQFDAGVDLEEER